MQRSELPTEYTDDTERKPPGFRVIRVFRGPSILGTLRVLP